jgi:hypothetical protein
VSLDGQQRAHRLSVRRLEPIPASTHGDTTMPTIKEAIRAALDEWKIGTLEMDGEMDEEQFEMNTRALITELVDEAFEEWTEEQRKGR